MSKLSFKGKKHSKYWNTLDSAPTIFLEIKLVHIKSKNNLKVLNLSQRCIHSISKATHKQSFFNIYKAWLTFQRTQNILDVIFLGLNSIFSHTGDSMCDICHNLSSREYISILQAEACYYRSHSKSICHYSRTFLCAWCWDYALKKVYAFGEVQ